MKRAILGLVFGLTACSANQQAQDLYNQVMTTSTSDLQQAYDLSVYNHYQPGIDCWGKLKDFIAAVQQRPQVTIGGATAAQVFLDLTSPDSQVNTACAALKAALKERVQSLIGQAATFAASIGL